MITPQELLVKSDKLFFKTTSAVLRGENLFPLVVPSNKKVVDTGFSNLNNAIVPIHNQSKAAKGKGYTVEWKIKNIEGTKQKSSRENIL